ncbi:uncharacterized protein LOC5511370 [Nematostella vectensis]|uniref:uncharacterized protein LOC5511370 n=1 Tax=Nematostella vectensis TaxID=45351 RepID=UPI00207729C7|nr:uncharacterized protein LOC5511370 [Nematostella vectensis]
MKIGVLLFLAVLAAVTKGSIVPLGCFSDTANNRGLKDYLGNVVRFNGENAKQVVTSCLDMARSRNMLYFGIQNQEECWASAEPKGTFNKHGCASNCVTDRKYNLGIGDHWSNYVYMVEQEWSTCSKTCGSGKQSRFEPVSGADLCTKGTIAAERKTKKCNLTPCRVNGGWSAYSSWSSCTKSCGGGTQTRTRTCTNPKPSNGGRDCRGDPKKTRKCGIAPCPEYEKLNGDHPVCFEAKERVYASVRVPHEGYIHSIKLVYRSGKVTCAPGHGQIWLIKERRHWTKWGCNNLPVLLLGFYMGTFITDSDDRKVLPETGKDDGQAEFKLLDNKWYKLRGYNENSNEIVLKREHRFHVRANDELRVWYGEALYKLFTFDNEGSVCVDVYIKYEKSL